MPNIKQLKIGNVDYDIKALKAANQGQYNAVVRDIAYGTESPSGGDNGAVYLQYNTSNTNNPYVYAEDTIGDQQNAADLYYSKNEVNNLIKEESDGYSSFMQKNYLAPKPASNPYTQNGVTFSRAIVMPNRQTAYVNINGTATDRCFYNFNTEIYELTPNRKYILSGFHDEWVDGLEVHVRYADEAVTIARASQNDVEFIAPSDNGSVRPVFVYVYVASGTVVNNKKWYPMIRDARCTSPEYVPYIAQPMRWMLATNTFTSGTVSIPANGAGSVKINITNPLDRRRPLAILRTWCNGNVIDCACNTTSTSNLTSATVWYKSPYSSTQNVTFTIEVLYINEDFVL